jgi:hypothetical protein
MRLNTTPVARTSGTDGVVATSASALISVGGSRTATTVRFVGRIYEIIAYDRALSNEEIDLVEDYLLGKYGI